MRFFQWMIGVAILGVAGTGTLWMLSPREAARLREEVDRLERERQALKQVVENLTSEDRVAEVHVIDQVQAGEMLNGEPAPTTVTTIEFIELDRDGHPLPSKRFIIQDNVIFFDAWVLKFDSEHVALGDALRGKNLALFRRIYGENQEPSRGFPIDASSEVPNIFRINPEASEFEQQLWARFWDLAKNPELADEQGVSVVQGEAVYMPMCRGEVWSLTLQNNGGLNIKLRRPAADTTDELSATRPAIGAGE